MSDSDIRGEMGRRIQAHRLLLNLDQETCATRAGVSTSTIYRLEKGGSVSTDALVKVLRTLNLLEGFDSLVPSPEISPVARAKQRQPKTRRRASGKRAPKSDTPTWGGFKQNVEFEKE